MTGVQTCALPICANILFSKSGKRFSRGEENRGYWEDLLE